MPGFIQEVKAHAALSAKRANNIIPILDHNLESLGKEEVRGFIAMPLAKSSLADHRELLTGRIELGLGIFAGIVRGIEAAHAAE